MSWYAEKNYPEINADHRSMVVACANLLQKFDTEMDPIQLNIVLTQDDPIVDWWSVPEYFGAVDIKEVYDDNSWPTSSKAIVKFRRIDEAAAGPVDHYCVVADHQAKIIIDSLDGKIKSASVYGEPQGWGSYVEVKEDFEEADGVPINNPDKEPDPEMSYTVLKGGESIYEIGLKLGLSAPDLIDHNSIQKPSQKVAEGTVLHLPVRREIAAEKKPRYELLPSPLDMHISREGGATKFGFGNIKKWKDVHSTGPTYPQNTNLKIVAIAHVPLDEPEEEALYCLDALSLGDYANSGRVDYTTGFNHAHLSEGHVERVLVVPKQEVQDKLEEAEKALQERQVELEMPAEEVVRPNFNDWKATQQPVSSYRVPVKFLNPKPITIIDLEEKRQPRTLKAWSELMIYSTFEKDGVLYGRHIQSVEGGNWLGIPMDQVVSEKELYNTDIPLEERVALNGHLSLAERYWWVPLNKSLGHYTRLKTHLGQKTKKEK